MPSLGGSDQLFSLLATRRPRVATHSQRVAVLAVRLASQYGLDREAIEAIRIGSLLHDVGKLLVSERVLDKRGTLSRREWGELSMHPEIGVELANRSGASAAACEIVLFHHERYDGHGYPDRLSGSLIPWNVRIVSVMDALDVMTRPVPGRDGISIESARAFMARQAGSQFCPAVVSGLLSMPTSLLDVGNAPDDSPWSFPDSVVVHDVVDVTQTFVPALS